MKKMFIATMLIVSSISPAHAELSQFSTSKGVKFGMTLNEVVNLTGATEDDFAARWKIRTSEQSECYKSENYTLPQCNARKPATSWYQAPVTVGGILFSCTANEFNELDSLNSFPFSYSMEEALDTFTKGYGKPASFVRLKSFTNGGVELDDFKATWIVKDAQVTMHKYVNLNKGYVSIEPMSKINKNLEEEQARKDKAAKDF